VRYSAIDEILDLQPGEAIKAIRRLNPNEDYLQDHFPQFPVMPGVLMLESLFQASAWLVRKSEEFAHSVVLLKETRQVKYGCFVKPGQVLTIVAKILKQTENLTVVQATGEVDNTLAVSGKLTLERFNLAERNPEYAASDPFARRKYREWFHQLDRRPPLSAVS